MNGRYRLLSLFLVLFFLNYLRVGGQPAVFAQSGARAAANAGPLTVSEVIEGLYSLGGARAEALVAKRGVRFQAAPEVLSLLKEFGASDKLIGMIPLPPEPAHAAPLTVTCEPADCAVIVGDQYFGNTSSGQIQITGLKPGEAALQVFNDDGGVQSRKIQLSAETPSQEKFVLSPKTPSTDQAAQQRLLDTLRQLGGIEGSAALAEFEGQGVLNWSNLSGQSQSWNMTFVKRVGRLLTATFKTASGQCTVSIANDVVKQECKGKLKNSAELVAARAAALFMTYQVFDVMQTFLDGSRRLLLSDDRLFSAGNPDSYALTLDAENLPAAFSHKTVSVKYSNFSRVRSAMYPMRLGIEWQEAPQSCVFVLTSVRSRLTSSR